MLQFYVDNTWGIFFIGAGAVVTKDVQNFALIVGNPGVQIGWIDKKGQRLDFDENGKSHCGDFLMKENS